MVAIVSPVAGLRTSMLRDASPPFAVPPVVLLASVVVPLSTVALLRSLLIGRAREVDSTPRGAACPARPFAQRGATR